MALDVTVERLIPLPPEVVADYAMDWRHDHEWTQGIREAQLTRGADADPGGFGIGAEVTRTARFLGKRIEYVLRVAAYEPPRLLDMVSVEGPMPMHITYSFTRHAHGTLARIRVRGDATGHYRFSRYAEPLMARKVCSSIAKDLRNLERILRRK